MRCPVSLARIHWSPGAKTLFYQGKAFHDDPFSSDLEGETLDIFEFLARVLTQIPAPRRHGPHYFGGYSSSARALRTSRVSNRNRHLRTLPTPKPMSPRRRLPES
jgi:hypothetical protein